jgi:hypothetical protein
MGSRGWIIGFGRFRDEESEKSSDPTGLARRFSPIMAVILTGKWLFMNDLSINKVVHRLWTKLYTVWLGPYVCDKW